MTSVELVRKLVAKGADVNARMTRKANINKTRGNELGATPFYLAAVTADAELLKLLASLGADPTLTSAENRTPLMAAAGLQARSPGEDAGTEPEVLEAIQGLLDLGADINAVDKNGETAMRAAAYKHLPQVVRFLAAKGAKILASIQDGRRHRPRALFTVWALARQSRLPWRRRLADGGVRGSWR